MDEQEFRKKGEQNVFFLFCIKKRNIIFVDKQYYMIYSMHMKQYYTRYNIVRKKVKEKLRKGVLR